jgi:geranylgeranyl pyrophosphate synthase
MAAQAQPDQVEIMGHLARAGVYAYQMMDDILDITADERD